MLSHWAPGTIRNCVFTLEKTQAKKTSTGHRLSVQQETTRLGGSSRLLNRWALGWSLTCCLQPGVRLDFISSNCGTQVRDEKPHSAGGRVWLRKKILKIKKKQDLKKESLLSFWILHVTGQFLHDMKCDGLRALHAWCALKVHTPHTENITGAGSLSPGFCAGLHKREVS